MKKIFTLGIIASLIGACGGGTSKNTKAVYMTDGGALEGSAFHILANQGVGNYTGNYENYIIPKSTTIGDLTVLLANTHKTTDIIVIGGAAADPAVKEYLKTIPEGKGIILTGSPSNYTFTHPQANLIQTEWKQLSFYVGYLAAKHLSENKDKFDTESSEGLKLGAFGGLNIPNVTKIIAGYQQGIEYWNNNLPDDGHQVEFMAQSNDGYYTGSFLPGKGKAMAEKLVNQEADMIFHCAGPQVLDALEVIENKKAHTLVIGFQDDESKTFEEHSEKFFTSTLSALDETVHKIIKKAVEDKGEDKYALGQNTAVTMDSPGEFLLATGGGNKLTKEEWETVLKNEKLKEAAKQVTDNIND